MRLIRTLVLLATLMLPFIAEAQTAYKGKVVISAESFARQGNLLRVKMRVNYGPDVASPGETLTITPVLKNDTTARQLSSVVITGDDLHGSRPRLQANQPVVVIDKGKNAKRVYYFDYDTTVPYAAWMPSSALYIESVRNAGKGRLHSYEDKIISRNKFNIINAEGYNDQTKTKSSVLGNSSDIRSCVQYLQPEGMSSKVFTVNGVMPLSKSLVHSKSLLEKIYNQIASEIKDNGRGRALLSVNLHGYSAPEGKYKRNERLAVLRQLDIKEYLMKQDLTDQAANKVKWTAEDWDSIAQIVRGTDMLYRSAVLDIIGTTDIAEGRERDLKKLAGGEPYGYLKKNVFPEVYRLKYSLMFRDVDNDLVTGRRTKDNETSQMSYSNLYGVAQTYGVGSANFRDLLKMGVRLYPNSTEANINAAAVAITEGNIHEAERLLKPYITDERAFCNLGVLYALQGNRDRAEVYLRMAAKKNISEAKVALRRLK